MTPEKRRLVVIYENKLDREFTVYTTKNLQAHQDIIVTCVFSSMWSSWKDVLRDRCKHLTGGLSPRQLTKTPHHGSMGLSEPPGSRQQRQQRGLVKMSSRDRDTIPFIYWDCRRRSPGISSLSSIVLGCWCIDSGIGEHHRTF